MLFNFSEQYTLANRFVAELRNAEIQRDRLRFRRNLERLGEVMAYEISKTLSYEPFEVETPLGISTVHLPTSRIVVASILRAGLPFHNGFLNFLDQADSAFIGAYRRHHKDGTFEIQVDYTSSPDLNEAVLIVVDPMLATGASVDVTLRELERFGIPKTIHIAAAIASATGIDAVKRQYPQARMWMGAIDEELTAKGYIVPGLGDAGDLAYGEKV